MDSLLNRALKRIIPLFGAFVLVSSLLCACSEKTNDETQPALPKESISSEVTEEETTASGEADFCSVFYPDRENFLQASETYYAEIPIFYDAFIQEQTLTIFGEYGALESGSFISGVSEHVFPLSNDCPIRSGPEGEALTVEEFHDRFRDQNFGEVTLFFHLTDGVITEIRLES